jgi:hypothetical protein
MGLELLSEGLAEPDGFRRDNAHLLQCVAMEDDAGKGEVQTVEGVINLGLLSSI